MKLNAVFVRFFRSLNFDYVRLSSPTYQPLPWDRMLSGAHYPFVQLKLESDITTVVGGNESGKSQMLAAIQAALTGKGFDRSDFCRYSDYFTVDKVIINPEFGALFTDISHQDAESIKKLGDFKTLGNVERVALFRMNDTPKLRLYVQQDGGEWLEPKHVKTPNALGGLGLPTPFYVDAAVPLPDSVPLAYLATGDQKNAVGRNRLRGFWDELSKNTGLFSSSDAVAKNAGQIADLFRGIDTAQSDEVAQFELAADLLLRVTGLGKDVFRELQRAVREENGYATSIVDTINSELAKSLNFPHWWSQDSQFELFVSLYEYDLVFMIRDRTGRSYGFEERSDGLRYFLSYFVQYLSHQPPEDGGAEILLMDEPDRFLSASGQQDLLRIFSEFAIPTDASQRPVQVVYVTHSPFLIDKNHSERIRVLEKGEHDEGTRIVASAAQNHYEPLRSALGSFVGETAFIGTCNLMLEGQSDQIILAGVSNWMARQGVPSLNRLDLNSLTLVPAGGANHVPYLVYLTRGRDVAKPPVIVLLDADSAGNEARKTIKRGGARRKPLVDDGLVLQLDDPKLEEIVSDNPRGPVDIEDLVPFDIAVEAVHAYCAEFVPDADLSEVRIDAASSFEKSGKSTLGALEHAVRVQIGNEKFHLDKVGFARSLVAILDAGREGAGADTLKANFRILLTHLGRLQREAVRSENVETISSRIRRARDRFIQNRGRSARREHVSVLIEEITAQLDSSLEAEDVRAELRSWHVKYKLDEDPRAEVEDIDSLEADLKSLAYTGVRNSEERS